MSSNHPVLQDHLAWFYPLQDPVHGGMDAHANPVIDWRQFSDIAAAAGRFRTPEDIRDAGRRSWQTPGLRLRASAGRAIFSVKDQFLAIYGPAGYCCQHFPFRSSIDQPRAGVLVVTMSMEPGAPGSNTFFHLLAGQMEMLPRQHGIKSAASVDLEVTGETARFQCHYRELSSPARYFRRITGARLAASALEYADQSDRQRLRSSADQGATAERASDQATSPEIPVPLLTFTGTHQIIHANAACGELFGWAEPELRLMKPADLVPPAFNRTSLDTLLNRQGSGTRTICSATGISRSGELIPLEISCSTQLEKTTWIIRDTRQQKALEKQCDNLQSQLEAAQKTGVIGQLTAGISHDVNNLLVAIAGYTNLASEADIPADTRQFLREISQAASRGIQMTRRLLDFNRPDATRLEVVDLDMLLADIRPMVTRLLPQNIQHHYSSPATSVYIEADPVQIEQVLLNLAINARDAMPAGGTLSLDLRVEPESSQVYLDISDTGSGISDDIVNRVFDPLFTTKAAGRGTGLGLAMVREIMTRHRGTVEVKSEPGLGSCFTLRLPVCHDRPKPVAAAKKHPSSPGGTETILIIDGNAESRELSRLILVGAGYQVLLADNGADGIKQFTESADRISLVLLDVVLPLIGGPETATQLRAIDAQIPLVFTADYGLDSPRLQFLEDSSLPCITRPCGPDTLRRTLREHLNASPHRKAETG